MKFDTDLRLVLDDPGEIDDTQASSVQVPSVFARAVQAPAGWPWEQTRAAMLEARHAAPLPIDEMQLRLVRLTPWRPNEPARFAACYVRASEVTERFEAQVDIEGRIVDVVFEPPEALAARARQSLAIAVASATVVAIVFVAITGALLARSQAEEQLSALERQADSKLRRAQNAQLAWRESAALAAAQPGARVDLAIQDLSWSMSTRDPEARLEAWRWEDGVISVQSRSPTPPFLDESRQQSRSVRPVRRFVWLWTVAPSAGA